MREMKIWLDDDYNDLPCDKPPDESWVHVHNWQEFKNVLDHVSDEGIEIMSFDHDLGEGQLSGHEIIKLLTDRCLDEDSIRLWPQKIECHSDNPRGKENIFGVANCFEREFVSQRRN